MGYGQAAEFNAVQHGGVGRRHRRTRRLDAPAYPALKVSRSTFFWIFPVDVFGSGPKTTLRGIL